MTQVNEKKAAVTPRGVRSPETCFSSLNSVVAQQHPGMGTGFAGRKRRKQGFDFNTLLQLFKYFLLFTNVSFLWDLNKFVSMMWPLPIGSYMPPASHLGQRRGVCMHRNRAQDIHYKTKKKKSHQVHSVPHICFCMCGHAMEHGQPTSGSSRKLTLPPPEARLMIHLSII